MDQTSLRRPICAAGQPQYGSLKGGIPTLPGWPFGVIDLPKVRYKGTTRQHESPDPWAFLVPNPVGQAPEGTFFRARDTDGVRRTTSQNLRPLGDPIGSSGTVGHRFRKRTVPPSGLSRSEFCWERGLALSTLGRYRRRREREAPAGNNALLAAEPSDRARATARAAGSASAPVLHGGRGIEVGSGFDVEALERLVRVLEGV